MGIINNSFPSLNLSSIERREGSRITSLYRPILIEAGEFAGFCLLRNLSPAGMMGAVYTQFSPGQAVTVHFHPDQIKCGRIVWSEEQRVGIHFDERVDVNELLKTLSSKHIGGKLNRAPRLQIACDGVVVIDGRTLPIHVQDISQRGIKAAVTSVLPDDEVTVRLDGMRMRKAIVRWTQSGTAGLNFLQPLGFEELAKWVIQRQSI